jgi:hypothetical protein
MRPTASTSLERGIKPFFVLIVGALTVGALMFSIPIGAAQNSLGSPGDCPFGGVCPAGMLMVLHTGSGIPVQERNGGLIRRSYRCVRRVMTEPAGRAAKRQDHCNGTHH